MTFTYTDANNDKISKVETTSNEVCIQSTIVSIGANFLSSSSSCIQFISFESDSKLKTLGSYCFAKSNALASVDLSPCKLLESIPEWCFYDSNIKSIIFPSNGVLTTLSAGTFSCCYLLKTIVIPKTIVTFADCLFDANGIALNPSAVFDTATTLSNIVFEEGSQLKYIGIYCFVRCYSLKSLIIPQQVSTICKYAFFDVLIEKMTITSPYISTIEGSRIPKTAVFSVFSRKTLSTLVKYGIPRRNITIYSVLSPKICKSSLPNLKSKR